MKKNTYKTIVAILIILATDVIAMCIIATVVPVKRTTKAVKYNLECVAGCSRNPLQECKE